LKGSFTNNQKERGSVLETFVAVIAAPKFKEEKARQDPMYLKKYATNLVKKASKEYSVEPIQLYCHDDVEPCLHIVRHYTRRGIRIAPILVYSRVNWKLSQSFWDEQYVRICQAMADMVRRTL
jgi:hypothetical protein